MEVKEASQQKENRVRLVLFLLFCILGGTDGIYMNAWAQ